MANLLNHNYNFIKLNPNMDEYYDFFINIDNILGNSIQNGNYLYDKCLISYIDTDIKDCVSGNAEWIIGVDTYKYESAITTDYKLSNIGYTGIDNGLINFNKYGISNKEFVELYSGSTYQINSGDTRLKLHQVSGNTQQYEYPLSYDGNKIKLNGGFFQGFFETEKNKYKILPTNLCNGQSWHLEFELMPKNFDKESDKTLNDKYSDNKGIFFYIGTRAENKWMFLYNESAETQCNNYIISGDSYSHDSAYSINDMSYNYPQDYFMKDLVEPYSIDGYMVEGNKIETKIRINITSDYSAIDDCYFKDEYDINESCKYGNILNKDTECKNIKIINEKKNCSCCTESLEDFLYDKLNQYPHLNEQSQCDNCGKYYIESSITSENMCYQHDAFDGLENTPYINNKSCQCGYFPQWEKCDNSSSVTPCSGCCKISLNEFLYDINDANFKGFSTHSTCNKCNISDNEYEDINFDCNDCDIYLSESEYFEKDLDITDFEYETDGGYELKISDYYEIRTDNGFLIYDRTCNGYTVNNWIQGDTLLLYGRKKEYKGNLFIYMNRTPTGYTINNIDSLLINNEKSYDYESDLYRNAFALQITDKGQIGYKYLVKNCDSVSSDTEHYSILSGYSSEGLIEKDKWYTINVKITSLSNKMKIYFYINGKLKYISSELPLFNFKALNILYQMQEGVPYNISIGGGSQGLCDVIMPQFTNIYNNPIYPIEKNFAGSFIGYFRKFRFYNCSMEYMDVNNNYLFDYKTDK